MIAERRPLFVTRPLAQRRVLAAGETPKTAFVLQGGGPKGIWQAVIARRLMREFGIEPDLLVCTSVGSINGALISHCGPEQAVSIWEDEINSRGDVWNLNLPWNWQGVYNTRPLEKKLRRHISNAPAQIPYLATAVNMRTWELELYDSRVEQDMVSAILSSSAIPVVVRPQNDRYDGGVRMLTPLKPAIDQGVDRIFAILCTTPTDEPQNEDPSGLAGHAMNALNIVLHNAMLNDIKIAEAYNQFRPDRRFIEVHLIAPKSELPIGDIDFSGDKLKALKQLAEQYPLAEVIGS